MRILRTGSFALAVLGMIAAPLTVGARTTPAAGAQAPPTMDDAIAAITAVAPAAMAYQGTPGLALAITDRTRTVRVLTFGYANVDAKEPVTPATRFAIGSITKSMTALALLEEHDAGKVDLNAPVTRYLPWFSIDSGRKPILVHQLLSHTAGLPDDYSNAPGWRYDLVALAKAKTLFEPGTKWSYSNDGFATAGAIEAAVDGRTWPEVVQARVLDRLGMSGATPVMTPETLSSAARGYDIRDFDRPVAEHPVLTASPLDDFVAPSGSVLATPEDMARYMRFYLNDGKGPDGKALLTPATFAAMTHADHFNNGAPAGAAHPEIAEAPTFYRHYGYGLSTFDENGDHLVGHTGGVSGYTSCMQIDLTRGFGVIAMANHVEAPLHPCAIMLYAMAVLRAQSQGRPLPTAWQAPDVAHVDKAAGYTGTYTSPAGKTLTVKATGDHLALIVGTQSIALYPRGGTTFWADDPRFAMYLINFWHDTRKGITGMNYGPQWFVNARFGGPIAVGRYPAAWNALAGRYENVIGLESAVVRVVIVRDRLTLDGTDPLKPRPDGTFALGNSIIRFGSKAGIYPQRMTFDDDNDFYRSDLP